jgi:peptidoglycan/LPS O-acetylase OafA/YrhL
MLIYIILLLLISNASLGLIPTLAALYAMIILFLPLRSNAIVTFFSKISFSLYLTHDIIGSNIVVYLGQIVPHTTVFKGMVFTTGIVISILFAYLFYKLVEVPALSVSKKIAYKSSQRHR